MIDIYDNFFVASVGASAAFIGLLFVALSFIDDEKTDEKVRNWRRIIANSCFAQLINVFFVSLVGLLPNGRSIALAGCIMSVLGLAISFRLLPQTTDRQHTGRRAPSLIGLAAVGVYSLELVCSVWLLKDVHNQRAMSLFMFALLLLYAGALARAWEISGAKNYT